MKNKNFWFGLFTGAVSVITLFVLDKNYKIREKVGEKIQEKINSKLQQQEVVDTPVEVEEIK